MANARFIFKHLVGQVHDTLFGEMRDEAGVRAMVEDGRCRAVPLRRHGAYLHLAVVERFLQWRLIVYVSVRVPFLNRGIHVKHLIVMAPVEYIHAAYIPCQVYKKPARRDILRELPRHVERGDADLGVMDALIGPFLQILTHVDEIDEGDILIRNLDML